MCTHVVQYFLTGWFIALRLKARGYGSIFNEDRFELVGGVRLVLRRVQRRSLARNLV